MTVSVRLIPSIAAVLSMLVMVTFSSQLTTDIKISQVQLIWRPVASWLRPPYFYLVINCIIITIFASSKLHQHHNDHEDQSKLVDILQPQSIAEIKCVEFSDKMCGNENYSVPTINPTVLVNNAQLDVSNNATGNYSDDGTTESVNIETWNLPGSAGFVHPKVVEANTEGRKKLGVQKPEQELETLESTWKAITDGRPMPVTHQDTGGGNLQDPPKIIKSEIFNQQPSSNRKNISRTLARSFGSGKLKRDPSLSQDELNTRADAFISRFKEDMRLQRKESLRQYVEMINSGAY